jgi:hypothetical protein
MEEAPRRLDCARTALLFRAVGAFIKLAHLPPMLLDIGRASKRFHSNAVDNNAAAARMIDGEIVSIDTTKSIIIYYLHILTTPLRTMEC